MKAKDLHPLGELLADVVTSLAMFSAYSSPFSYSRQDMAGMCGRLLNLYFRRYPDEILRHAILAMGELQLFEIQNRSVVSVLREMLKNCSNGEDPLIVLNRAVARIRNKQPQNANGSLIPDLIWNEAVKLAKNEIS